MADLVAELRGALGAKLVAYIGGLSETRTVSEWIAGHAVPSEDVEVRLRVAHRVAALMLESDDSRVVQVWFQGTNKYLSDRAPARLLRDGNLGEFEPAIIAAAREHSA